MYEGVAGHFYLPKWAGPTVENTFCSTKNPARSEKKKKLKKFKMEILAIRG